MALGLLFDFNQNVAGCDLLVARCIYFLHSSIKGRHEGGLHFHGRHHDEPLPFMTGSPSPQGFSPRPRAWAASRRSGSLRGPPGLGRAGPGPHPPPGRSALEKHEGSFAASATKAWIFRPSTSKRTCGHRRPESVTALSASMILPGPYLGFLHPASHSSVLTSLRFLMRGGPGHPTVSSPPGSPRGSAGPEPRLFLRRGFEDRQRSWTQRRSWPDRHFPGLAPAFKMAFDEIGVGLPSGILRF